MSQNVNAYLGTEKISKLMMQYSIPCIMSLLIASLYNMVDQIFIGNGIGILGNGATNVVFPITVISLAVCLMIGDGTAAALSLCQGQNDSKKASATVATSLVFLAVVSVVMTILFALFQEAILWGFGATENNISYAREYFDSLLFGIPFFMFGTACASLIRADGNPRYSMMASLCGCLVNIVLDPIAIFVLKWSMTGAALATVAGQIVTALICFAYLRKAKTFRIGRESFAFRFSLLRHSLMLGISSFLTQISVVVLMGCMNNVLVHYGSLSEYGPDIPLTVLGIVMKVYQLMNAFAIGVAVGCQPIVGYNYGAGNLHRVKELFMKLIVVELVIGTTAVILFQCYPLQLISLFGHGDALYNQFAIMTFRTFLCTCIFTCCIKACAIFLQSLGKPALSTLLTLTRDFLVMVPAILIFPRFLGVEGVLYSSPLADSVAIVLTSVAMIRILKTLKEPEAAAKTAFNEA